MAKNKNKKPTTGNKNADKVLRRVRIKMSTKLIIFGVITLALAISLIFLPKINHAMKLDEYLANKQMTSDEEISLVKNGDLRIHFIDVGQGDSTIIEFPDGKKMIIDGGEKDQKEKLLAYIADNIKDKKGNPIKYFDYCVLTHTDSDHCGSLDDVLNAYPALTVYRPNVVGNRKGYTDPAIALTRDAEADANVKLWYGTENNANSIVNSVNTKSTVAYQEFLEAAYDSDNKENLPDGKETTVYVTDGRCTGAGRPSGKHVLDIGSTSGYKFEFYGAMSANYKDWNNYSPIMLLNYKGKNVVLTGDAEKEAEADFVNFATNTDFKLNADILKLGHHGSRTSSSEDFLKVALRKSPTVQYANCFFVVSCGLNNSYGHPHKETITRLTEAPFSVQESNIWRTDVNGTIMVAINAGAITTTNGTINLQPSFVAQINDSPLDYWHLALTAEGVAFIAIFLIVGTKKSTGKKRRNKKDDSDKSA